MILPILKRPQAERDIEECFVFIAEENLDAGVYFLVAVEDSIEQLAEFPLMGSRRNFTNPRFQNVRMRPVKDYRDYLIFYSVGKEEVEIIRVLHRSRDIVDLFSSE